MFLLREAGADRAAFCIEVQEPIKDADEPVATEWSHAYTAMGLPFQHPLQTACFARTYNLEVAACFIRSIHGVLGCGVRASSIGIAPDEAGAALLKRFSEALAGQDVLVAPEDPHGQPLASIAPADLEAPARATQLASCRPFLEALLGPARAALVPKAP